jgi:hypothetical protein
MQLQVARHLFLVFHDINWKWEGLTVDEKLIYPDQSALDTLRSWAWAILAQETLDVK